MRTSQLMTTGRVARALGVSENWVRRMDDQLQPQRTAEGRRLYNPQVVERVAGRRHAAAATTRGHRR